MTAESEALTGEQVVQYREQGYLFLPEVFGADEVNALREEALSIFRGRRREIWREMSGAPRTAFAAHT